VIGERFFRGDAVLGGHQGFPCAGPALITSGFRCHNGGDALLAVTEMPLFGPDRLL
jgi:hypothetical protein